MSKPIPLTRGLTALVDDADYDWLRQWKWMRVGTGYAGRFDSATGKLIYMHRLILDAPADQDLDHINGDRLDNRRANLSLVPTTQNLQNQRIGAHNTSGCKGVCWHKQSNKWHVRISWNGKRIHLGYERDLETAALLYDAAARYFFGEYARPNYPDMPTPFEVQLRLADVLERVEGQTGCQEPGALYSRWSARSLKEEDGTEAAIAPICKGEPHDA